MNINITSDHLHDEYFPVIITPQTFDVEIYQRLKSEFPDFSKYNAVNAGNAHRLNITMKKDNDNYKKLKQLSPSYCELYDYLDSDEFKEKVFAQFTPDILAKYGFIGDISTINTEIHIAKSVDNYQNPWHVDTRGRIIHGLVYFGKDEIKSGGELGIAKHKTLNKWEDYPQFPKLKDLSEFKTFEPEDNLGIFVLSTPNSYHRGLPLKGVRKFLYIAFNNSKKPTWKCGWNNSQRPFPHGIKIQNDERKHDKNHDLPDNI